VSVDDLDIDDLLAALNDVADAHNGDGDDSDIDREEGEDGEQDDGDDNDDGDYASSPTVMRLRRLATDAKTFKLPRGIAATKRPLKPIGKAHQNIRRVADLRSKTQEMNYEMECQKLLATATNEHKKASLAFHRANRTPEEKAEHEADMRRIAYCYSGICKEASPDWREEATAAFGKGYRQ
jgi:hypothetical protein